MFNDLLSHRFLSLCFTKNSICQKTNTLKSKCCRNYISFARFFLVHSPSRPRMWACSFKQSLESLGAQTFSAVGEHTHSSLSYISGGLAQHKTKVWIFPGDRHSLLNSFSHLAETGPLGPAREVAESNLEGTLMKSVGAQ